MGLKQILTFGIILLDLAAIIFIISKIGAKNFGYFFLMYIFGLIAMTLFLGVAGYLQPKKWKKMYEKKNKVQFIKAIPILLMILGGFGSIYIVGLPLLVGFMTSCFVTLYIVFCFGDLLHIITNYTEVFDDMMVKKYKWLKK